jgi:hypothetical protein
MLNCYCQLTRSVIFRQYGVSQSDNLVPRGHEGPGDEVANQNAKFTGPDQGFLVSPLVLIRKPWERGCVLPYGTDKIAFLLKVSVLGQRFEITMYWISYSYPGSGPPWEFAEPGANLLWGPHNIIIFKLNPSQSPNYTRPWLDCMWSYCKGPSIDFKINFRLSI